MPHISRELLAKLAVERQSGHNLFAIGPEVRQRPLGPVRKLPQELLLMVLELLDLQSLCRLSQTSFWARLLVLDFRPYREILEHAPTLPQTLAKARLLSRYSAHQISCQVLRSDQCSSCSSRGAYVFLLTCERVCTFCFSSRDSFQVIEMSLAESIFQLNGEKLAAAPAYYCARQKMSFVRTNEMKEIAAMANAPLSLFAALGLDKQFIGYCSKWLICTITPIPLPSGAWPDGGRQCAGCLRDNPRVYALTSPRASFSVKHMKLLAKIHDREARRYTQTDFWDHIKHCRLAQRLLWEWK